MHALPPREASEMLVSKARQRARGGGDNLSLALAPHRSLWPDQAPRRRDRPATRRIGSGDAALAGAQRCRHWQRASTSCARAAPFARCACSARLRDASAASLARRCLRGGSRRRSRSVVSGFDRRRARALGAEAADAAARAALAPAAGSGRARAPACSAPRRASLSACLAVLLSLGACAWHRRARSRAVRSAVECFAALGSSPRSTQP